MAVLLDNLLQLLQGFYSLTLPLYSNTYPLLQPISLRPGSRFFYFKVLFL